MKTPKTKRRKFVVADIYSPFGTKVFLWKPKWGHDHDCKRLKKHKLKLYREYTIEKTVVHSFSTDFYLVEFPGVYFNSVHFATLAQ